MSHEEKPLPRPPSTPFGRRRAEAEGGPLLADRIAEAMAEGRLEEFVGRELPDSPYARELATMMMGMTGILPPGGAGRGSAGAPAPDSAGAGDPAAPPPRAAEVPAEVLAAAQSGDVGALMDALRREHGRRAPGTEAGPPQAPPPAPPAVAAAIERETLDGLVRIAEENGVTPEWVLFRAIRRYVEEHRRSGAL